MDKAGECRQTHLLVRVVRAIIFARVVFARIPTQILQLNTLFNCMFFFKFFVLRWGARSGHETGVSVVLLFGFYRNSDLKGPYSNATVSKSFAKRDKRLARVLWASYAVYHLHIT
jgi:hypothetical protein